MNGDRNRHRGERDDSGHDLEQPEGWFDFVLRMIALVAIVWLVYFAYVRL